MIVIIPLILLLNIYLFLVYRFCKLASQQEVSKYLDVLREKKIAMIIFLFPASYFLYESNEVFQDLFPQIIYLLIIATVISYICIYFINFFLLRSCCISLIVLLIIALKQGLILDLKLKFMYSFILYILFFILLYLVAYPYKFRDYLLLIREKRIYYTYTLRTGILFNIILFIVFVFNI